MYQFWKIFTFVVSVGFVSQSATAEKSSVEVYIRDRN
jgi:hypothetical protein